VISQNAADNAIDLILKVKDTGIGIPKEDHKKIFQAFDQMDMQDNKKYEGTGLGLAITQQFVNLMNGTIELKSKLGEGSTFIVTLKKVNVGQEAINAEEKSVLDSNLIQFDKSTVLIVDDIKTNRKLLKEYLKDYNIDILEAKNGKEALIVIEKQIPDLVFMDLRMPIMDGFEAIEIIKKKPKWSNIPNVAITASVFDKDEQEALERGFTDYVRKPISSIDILKILKKYLKYTIVPHIEEPVTEISFQPIEKLDDLMLEIEKTVTPLLAEINKIRAKKKVLLLADQIIDIGKKFDATQFIHYGEELQMACKLFNISKEKELIKLFPEFIENLNSQHNTK